MPTGIYKRNLAIIKKGDKYNYLTAIKFSHKIKTSQCWFFKCDCGNEKVFFVNSVKQGNSKSCGCLKIEKATIHGMEGTKTYKSWNAMKTRCLNKNDKGYKNYGGRGITICPEWMKFENFYKDMGERPKDRSIDRIDNDGNYNKENCHWATRTEQQNNKRNNRFLTYQGKTQNIKQWSEELNIKAKTIGTRIHRGWNDKKILTYRSKF